MTIEQLKTLLQRYNIKPNKTFGQHFLLNDIVLQDMVDSVPVKRGELLLEVGPGIGNLTRVLIQTEHEVMSVEKDTTFLPMLKSIKKEFKNFDFRIQDILKFNLATEVGGRSYHVVANIPYYVTGKIIQLFVTTKHKPRTITLLIQKEVAENLSARPGNLNLLALSVQLYGDVRFVQKVLARDFYPAPKVDSAIVQIVLHDKPKYDVEEKKFFALLRACFAGKRKQLHNTLKNFLHVDTASVEKILQSANIDPRARPQELSLGEWIELYNKLQMTSSK